MVNRMLLITAKLVHICSVVYQYVIVIYTLANLLNAKMYESNDDRRQWMLVRQQTKAGSFSLVISYRTATLLPTNI